MPAGKRNIMRAFKIDEISTVDRPAQRGARALIMKSKEGVEPMPAAAKRKIPRLRMTVTSDNALVERVVKYYVDPAKGAMSFGDVFAECEQREEYEEVMRECWPLVQALDTSLNSIIADRDVDWPTKQIKMRTSVEEFLAAIREKWPEVEEVLTKALETVVAKSEEELDMAGVKELEASIAALTKSVTDQAAASAAAIAAITKRLDDEAAAKAAEIEKAKPANGKDKEDLDDEEMAWARKLKGKARDDFMGMTRKERSAAMKTKKSDDPPADDAGAADESLEIDGQSITKSEAGPAVFAVLKAQAKRSEELEKRNAEVEKSLGQERERREMLEFTKRAEAEMEHLPGTVEEKAQMLKALSTMPEGQRKQVEKMLAAGDKAISAGFDKIGHRQGAAPANGNTFMKHVSDIQARDRITKSAAMTKARQEHPEAFEAYQNSN